MMIEANKISKHYEGKSIVHALRNVFPSLE